MKKILFFILPIILLSTACKKKEKDPEPTPPASTTGSTTQPTTFNGWLRAYNEFQYLIGAPTPSFSPMLSFARAFFTSTNLATTLNATFTPVYGGLVVASTVDTLQYYSTTVDYENNLSALPAYSVPVKWSVGGATGSTTSFTTNCSEAFPGMALSSFTVFPANISKNAGVTITLSGFSNADRVRLDLQDNSGNLVSSNETTLSSGSVTVTFTGAQTAGFINTNLGAFYLYVYNDEIQNVGGKNIRFSNVTEYYINGFNINN